MQTADYSMNRVRTTIDGVDITQDVFRLTVKELKSACRGAGISTRGLKKAGLRVTWQEHLNEEASALPAEEDAKAVDDANDAGAAEPALSPEIALPPQQPQQPGAGAAEPEYSPAESELAQWVSVACNSRPAIPSNMQIWERPHPGLSVTGILEFIRDQLVVS
jgi:hypothetical protein